MFLLCFFFSSRRRHTRLTCDWSSDVCSSDLNSLPVLVREFGHLRWQEEINEFKLANQHLHIKHMLHHEPNSIQIFLFLKLFVLTFFSLFVAQYEPRLQKKRI